MFFSIKIQPKYWKLSKYTVVNNAKRAIFNYTEGVTEKLWNQYLLEHYQTHLKLMCLKLIEDINISYNFDDTLIVTFETKEANDIATLITYGNGLLKGSSILQTAFNYSK